MKIYLFHDYLKIRSAKERFFIVFLDSFLGKKTQICTLKYELLIQTEFSPVHLIVLVSGSVQPRFETSDNR